MTSSEPGKYNDLANAIQANIYSLNRCLEDLRNERNETELEVRKINGLKKEAENDFLPYPHIIIDDEYMEYHLNVNVTISNLVLHGVRYTIPTDLRKHNVYGKIIFTVKRNGYNTVIRTDAMLTNYIHQSSRFVCTGSLYISSLNEDNIERLINQFGVANLDSTYNTNAPYRSLRTLAGKLKKEGINDRAWSI